MYHPFTVQSSAFRPKYLFLLHLILTIHSNYLPQQH